jgi:hypothetical protein
MFVVTPNCQCACHWKLPMHFSPVFQRFNKFPNLRIVGHFSIFWNEIPKYVQCKKPLAGLLNKFPKKLTLLIISYDYIETSAVKTSCLLS